MKTGKKIILAIVALYCFSPVTAIPENINVIHQSDGSIINGKMYAASSKLGKIYYRGRVNGRSHLESMQFAEALSSKRLWKELTAIAEVESNFNCKAKGTSGDSGAYQVIEKEWGRVPRDVRGQSDQAERILEQLLKESKNKTQAIRKYNGSLRNPKTKLYAQKVQRVINKIQRG